MGSLMKTSAHCVVAVKKASKMLGCIKDRTIWKNITASISLRGPQCIFAVSSAPLKK